MRQLRRLCAFLIGWLFIGINFGIILGFKKLQQRVQDTGYDSTSKQAGMILLSLVISLILTSSFYLLKLALIRLTNYSFHYAEIVFKLTLAFFVNYALVVLLTNKIVRDDRQWKVFGSAGIVGNMIILMIVSVFSDSFVYLFDPVYFFKLFRRRRLLQTAVQDQLKVQQCELNDIYEGITFDIWDAYFMQLKTLAVAFFYQAFIPYGLLIGAVEMSVKYVVLKYYLINRCTIPNDLEFAFNRKMVKLLEMMILILALGYMVFDMILQIDDKIPTVYSIIMVSIAGFDWVVGTSALIPFMQRDIKPTVSNTYQDCLIAFPYNYDRLNPLT
jgi:hypothetical protein